MTKTSGRTVHNRVVLGGRAVITPFILGHGKSGWAVARCLAMLRETREFAIEPIQWIERGKPIQPMGENVDGSVLFICNPHALHAKAILAADRAGFRAIFCEKPACVRKPEVSQLKQVRARTAVFHVYRQMWGPQTIRGMIDQGVLGEIFAIEGRFWHSSTAERVLEPDDKALNWKNDPALSGPHDALLDIGTHWVDTAIFLAGSSPVRAEIWKSYAGAKRGHRDSHLQLSLEFSEGFRAYGSISKMAHGSANDFDIHVLGLKGTASWSFRSPDEIVLGEGRDRRVLTRRTADMGARLPPFHGAGWLEGYMEIIRQMLRSPEKKGGYPTLTESLKMLEVLFDAGGN